jgi:hypothetical protein
VRHFRHWPFLFWENYSKYLSSASETCFWHQVALYI